MVVIRQELYHGIRKRGTWCQASVIRYLIHQALNLELRSLIGIIFTLTKEGLIYGCRHG